MDEAGSLSTMFHYCPSHSDGVAIYQSRPALQYEHFLSSSLVKATVFPVVMYGCESWTVKKAERQRIMLLNCGVGEDS